MNRRNVFLKAALILMAVWGVVWGVRSIAESKKITAELVNREISKANFADWSGEASAPDAAESARRDKELRRIADLVNRLDFHEREKNRENRTGENFFRKLTPTEKGTFIEITVAETMGRFMETLDAMPPEQRKKFVEQGLKDIQSGRTEAEMARADELGDDLLEKITQEGLKAYFEKSSADTKLDLAPLMEAMNDTIQGMRGNEFNRR